jgi:protein-tyrosine phosphatase
VPFNETSSFARPFIGTGGILFVCTANVCRSPMAAALLAQQVSAAGITLPVGSAGLLAGGQPALPHAAAVMAALGIDLSAHVSRRLEAADLAESGLVLGMTREHVRHAVVLDPQVWPRAFTLRELIRRAGETGPPSAGEPFAGWLGRLHAGRDRRSLLGGSPLDDIADPAGGPAAAYGRTAVLLDGLTSRLAGFCCGTG